MLLNGRYLEGSYCLFISIFVFHLNIFFFFFLLFPLFFLLLPKSHGTSFTGSELHTVTDRWYKRRCQGRLPARSTTLTRKPASQDVSSTRWATHHSGAGGWVTEGRGPKGSSARRDEAETAAGQQQGAQHRSALSSTNNGSPVSAVTPFEETNPGPLSPDCSLSRKSAWRTEERAPGASWYCRCLW